MSAEARREQLVQAAIEVMSREGLERATTRRIAQQAGTAQGAMHYAFRDKNELLTAVIGAITVQIEQLLREAIDPSRGLAAAINDGLRAFWRFAVSDDGLQLMQYELAIFCCRTPGYEWLATWQHTRYTAAAQEVFQAAIDHEPEPQDLDLLGLCRFVVAAVDGLILQYQAHHDIDQSERDLGNVIRCATMLAGLNPPR